MDLSRDARLWRGLNALPFMNELFFGMQARNLVLVDSHLADWESEVLHVHIEQERTPVPELMTLSAFSQLWIFGIYELLRTWRQQAKFVIRLGDKVAAAKSPDEANRLVKAASTSSDVDDANIGASYFNDRLDLARDPAKLQRLKEILGRVEPVFVRLETLRVTLAKHEIPKTKGVPSIAPGYARQDMMDGCLIWPVYLNDDTMDLISRTQIVEGIVSFAAV